MTQVWSDERMQSVLTTPGVDDLSGVVQTLRGWQHAGAPIQLHPGDVGWFGRFGAEATAAALRVWRHEGRIVALALLDGPQLARTAVNPSLLQDTSLARHMAADLVAPERGILPPGTAAVETAPGAVLHDALGDQGWGLDESWALLTKRLDGATEEAGAASEAAQLRIETVEAQHVGTWAAVHQAAFGMSHLDTSQIADRWLTMRSSPAFRDARTLLAFSGETAVAAATVWSAGPGAYGLIEPLGAHPDHRGRGLGRAITLSAASALQQLGSTVAVVVTPLSNPGAVATYKSAGFTSVGERRDRQRA